jgi:hypothetical protein
LKAILLEALLQYVSYLEKLVTSGYDEFRVAWELYDLEIILFPI